MKNFYGYIRVSTAKQGEQGVSLAEQRDAILRFAQKNDLVLGDWFEERETAAKRGRPIFPRMLKLLRTGKAAGVIIHKIDRSARNMKDWAEIGELIDSGIDVRFANEGLDLTTRGGRLSADLQAVVAADFIRNLREETKKGFYGRLKQGLYPMPAPIGYLDRGKGQVKVIDPVRGPLVRKAFELYGSGKYNLDTLTEEMFRIGLRNRNGHRVPRNSLSKTLNNPFYFGVVRLRHSGETFAGVHEPLISKGMFDRVHNALHGKIRNQGIVHDFLLRRLFTCQSCGYVLVGERQKGHVYYRCHTPRCSTTGIREEVIEMAIRAILARLEFTEQEKEYAWTWAERFRVQEQDEADNRRQALALRASTLDDRLGRLTDAFLDGAIEKNIFEERKTALVMERQDVRNQFSTEPPQSLPERMADFLELLGNAYLSYEMGTNSEKREILKIVTSNRQLDGKTPVITLSTPFDYVANRSQDFDGSPSRSTARTLERLLRQLGKWLTLNPTVSFKRSEGRPKQDNKRRGFVKGAKVAA